MSLVDDLSSFVATAIRGGRGLSSTVATEHRPDPPRLLELWDFEACPYCRKVREVLCELDLDYRAHPVAHRSPRRTALRARGGRVQAPFLDDPNTGTALYESAEIIAYLNDVYGAGRRAGWWVPVPDLLDNIDSMLASAARLGRGAGCRATRDREGLEPLTLWNMEGSPYCRKVREALSELDLAHVVRNVPKGSPRRATLAKLGGKVQVPYLIDPNGGWAGYESDDIVAYLEREYGAAAQASTVTPRQKAT